MPTPPNVERCADYWRLWANYHNQFQHAAEARRYDPDEPLPEDSPGVREAVRRMQAHRQSCAQCAKWWASITVER